MYRGCPHGAGAVVSIVAASLLVLFSGDAALADGRPEESSTNTPTASHPIASQLSNPSGLRRIANATIGEKWTSVGPTQVPHCGQGGIFGALFDFLAPCSGRVTAIAPDPTDGSGNTIYLGAAQGGVWKTTDGGLSWAPLLDNPITPDGNPLTGPLAEFSIAVGSITVAPTGVVYVGTGEPDDCGPVDCFYGAGILRSDDGGRTWTQLGLNYFERSSFYNVVVNTNSPMQLLAAATSGLWSSSDGGQTWANINASFPAIAPGSSFTAVVADPANSSIVYAAGGGEIFKSSDAGNTWTLLTPVSTGGCYAIVGSCSRIGLSIAASSPSMLVAAAADGTLWRTIDSGATWSQFRSLTLPANFCANQCTYDLVVAIDPVDPTVILLGGEDLYVTIDGGAVWVPKGGYSAVNPAGGTIHADQHAIAFSPIDHEKIFVGNDGGIWSATWHRVDVGFPNFPWVDLNANLSITQFYSVAANPQELSSFIGGTQDIGVVEHDVYSSDSHELAATVWDDSNAGDGGWTAYDPSSPTTEYAGMVGWSSGGCAGAVALGACLLRRDGNCCFNTNGWSGVFPVNVSSVPYSFPLAGALDPSTPSTIYFPSPTTGILYKSTDRGDHWSATGLDLNTTCGGLACGSITVIKVAPSNSDYVYIGTSNGRLLASGDGGGTFHERDSGALPGVPIEGLAVDAANAATVYATLDWFSGGGRHVFVSRNAGDFSSNGVWTDISSGLPDFPVHALVLDPIGSGAIYVGTDTGVFTSTDSGGTWDVLGTGLPRVEVTDLAFSAGGVALVAATHGRGVWTISHLPGHPSTYISTYRQQIGADAQSVEADCYPGDFATGGGFEIPSGVVKEPVASEPNVSSGEPTGWVARFGVGTGGTVSVFADCMASSSAAGASASTYVIEAHRFLRAPAGGVTAPCNGIDPVTGGGFETAGSKVVRQSNPNVSSGTPSGWTAFFGISLDFTGVTVKAFAVCRSGQGFSTNVASETASFDGSPHGISVSCPSGEPSLGGGFTFSPGSQVPLISEPDFPGGIATGWMAFFGAGTGGTGAVLATCMTGATSTLVSCRPFSVLAGASTTCTATVSNLEPSFSMTPEGSVTFTSDKAGSFIPSPSCVLSGSTTAGGCALQFTPSAVGVVTISAVYSGDSNHLGSTGVSSISVFDFTVSATPLDSTVLRGSDTQFSVATRLVAGSVGFPASVGLTVSGLPSDASFTPSSIALPGISALTIHTGTVSLGDFTLSISGTVVGGSRSATTRLHLYDFIVNASPSSLNVLTTGSNSYSVTVQLTPGSSLAGLPMITLTVGGLPPGATGVFNPVIGAPSFTSALTITTANTAIGTNFLTISGTDARSPEGGTRAAHPILVVLTSLQALQLIVSHVNDLRSKGVLNNGQANSLIVKLTHAIDQLNTRPDKKSACNQLSAFVHEVNAYVSASTLTPAQANALLGPPVGVQAIMTAIAC